MTIKSTGSLPSGHLLTVELAERVMGWGVGTDRYMTGNRSWRPRWRFQPITKLEDAFDLLEHATPESYSMCSADNGSFSVRVQIKCKVGEATHESKALAITLAVARALGLEV